MKKKLPRYEEIKDNKFWFCLSHKRQATHLLFRKGMKPEVVCDPKLGGIMLCCVVTDKCGIDYE